MKWKKRQGKNFKPVLLPGFISESYNLRQNSHLSNQQPFHMVPFLGSHCLDSLAGFVAWLRKRFLGITKLHRTLLSATAQDCHQHLDPVGPQAVPRDDLEAAMQLLQQNLVYSYCFPQHRKSNRSPRSSFCILLLSLSVAGSQSTSHLTSHNPSHHCKSSEIQELIILPLHVSPLAIHHPSCCVGQPESS